ncbi:MAG: ATP-binding protein [Bacteroidota bacterium]
MYLLGKRADTIESKDIIRLIENGIPENKSLDYKKEIYLGKDADKKEFLFDISAMYNTDGGCIIYGIEEIKDEKKQNTGKPKEICNIEIDNVDKLTQLIEDLVKGNTEPSINHLVIKVINVEEKNILLIGIPKGLGLPAMSTFNQTNKFYRRRNSGKYSVDVYELNQMFMQNQLLNEKANEFRTKRIQNVLNQIPFPNLDVNIPFFIHIIPYSFLDNQILDFSTSDSDLTIKMRPMLNGGWDKMYNLDGFATFSLSNDRLKISAYNQIFRNGIYEIYTSDLFYTTRNGKEGFDSSTFIETIIENINTGISNLNHMQIEPPFLVSYSFHNIKGKVIDTDRSFYNYEFKQNEIIFPLIQIPDYSSNVYEFLKPNFDILWQSLGFAKSPKYPI